MTQHPEKRLTADDIPAAINGAPSYSIRACATGGFDIFAGDTWRSHRPSEQAALREAIRYQKRANIKGGSDDRA